MPSSDADSMSTRDMHDPPQMPDIRRRRYPQSLTIGQFLALEGESIYAGLDGHISFNKRAAPLPADVLIAQRSPLIARVKVPH